MANREIGEVEITIGAQAYLLRPTFSALAEIEDKADKSLMDLAQQMGAGKIKFKDVVAIVYGGILGATPDGAKMPFSYNELGNMIAESGYLKLPGPVTMFFLNAIKGREGKKEEPQVPVPA